VVLGIKKSPSRALASRSDAVVVRNLCKEVAVRLESSTYSRKRRRRIDDVLECVPRAGAGERTFRENRVLNRRSQNVHAEGFARSPRHCRFRLHAKRLKATLLGRREEETSR
jgi:hypothetical protein